MCVRFTDGARPTSSAAIPRADIRPCTSAPPLCAKWRLLREPQGPLRPAQINADRSFGVCTFSLVASGATALLGRLVRDAVTDFVGRSEVGVAAGAVALPDFGKTAPPKRSFELGMNLQRRVEVGDGAVEVALFVPGDAAVGVGSGVFGIKPDHLVEVGDGAVQVALGLPGEATEVVGDRVDSLRLLAVIEYARTAVNLQVVISCLIAILT